ncbi:SusC/RagA family TonB-linked outer membrane protein [Parapedobacter sp. 2B3]|uniref:SusC/RagA family TonB-linked outer membrane protein n=1 Tax=Parapedobacter sp. 2B3 TaxID=3342381 RepID=UPI0035B602F7
MNYPVHANTLQQKTMLLQGIGTNPRQILLAMKLALLLLLAFSLHATADALAQKIDIQVSNQPLDVVFKKIREQSDYSFVFKASFLQYAKPVTVAIKDKEITDVLPIIFAGQPFDYEIKGKVITLLPKPQVMPAPNQQITIRGRVTDSLNNPLVGVTVQVKESGWQTITDREGRYEITGVYPTETLHFRLLSYQPYETSANRPEINVTLRLLYSELQEVDVSLNTGYQNMPKERATGSFVQINNEMLNRRVSTDIVSRLEGITNGLAFYRSSASEQPTLNIRGRSTIFANNTPLIVLDNFPFDGDINNINPNDIESITVLKDAAAASIWGVRAGNGVIVINTKRGRTNQPPRIELNTNVTIGEKPDSFYLPRMSSADFIELETEFFNRGYYASQENSNQRPALTPVQEILIAKRDELVSEAEASSQIESLKQYDVRNDFQKYFLRNSVNQQYALNVSGGGNKSSYFLSLGHDNNASNAVGNGYRRYSVNASNNFSPMHNLELSASVMHIVTETDNNSNGIADLAAPYTKKYYSYAQLADESGNPLPISYGFRDTYKSAMEANGFMDWQYRPLEDLRLSDNRTRQYYNRINLGVTYTVFEGLSAEIKYQFEKSNTKGYNHLPQNMYFTRDLINRYYTPDGVRPYPVPMGDIMDSSVSDLTGNSGRAQLNFEKDWINNNVNIVAGFEAREVKAESNQQRLYGFDPETLTSRPVDYETLYITNPASSRAVIPYPRNISILTDRFISYYANIGYTLLDRYTLSASGRIDQSNLFGVQTNQNTVPLWSSGIKWDIDKEPFFQTDWLNTLKLRTTYGYNGNLDKSTTALLTGRYGTALATSALDITLNGLPNPQLRWEKSSMLNIGINFAILNQKLTGNIEYYRKNGMDLIGSSTSIDPTTGFTSFRGNMANMKGDGLDVEIFSKNIDRSFQWTTGLLFSHATDKVTKYHDISTSALPYILSSFGNSASTISPLLGYPVQSIYSFRFIGLDSNTGDPIGYRNGEETTNARNIFLTSTTEELIFNGPVNPVFFGGVRNDFRFKGVTISFNVTYKLGHYFRRPSVDYSNFMAYWHGNKDYRLRWQKPGDELKTNVPSIPLTSPDMYREYYFYGNSETLVERGDHIRLQDINIRYTIEKIGGRTLPIRNLQIYVYGNNLGILWKANKHGIDPDSVPYSGANFLPTPRSFSIGLKAGI